MGEEEREREREQRDEWKTGMLKSEERENALSLTLFVHPLLRIIADLHASTLACFIESMWCFLDFVL